LSSNKKEGTAHEEKKPACAHGSAPLLECVLGFCNGFIRRVTYFLSFISKPENPRLSSLGMNGTRSEAEANHLSGPKRRALARGAASFFF